MNGPSSISPSSSNHLLSLPNNSLVNSPSVDVFSAHLQSVPNDGVTILSGGGGGGGKPPLVPTSIAIGGIKPPDSSSSDAPVTVKRTPSGSLIKSNSGASLLPTKNNVPWRRKLLLVLVGLPARGKSYIAYKIVGYLRWRGMSADLFNVGKARRQKVTLPQDHDFFSANNQQAQAARDDVAFQVLQQMLQWLADGGDCGVFDATNTTRKRRAAVLAYCNRYHPDLNVVFVESICDDEIVLESNYRSKAQNSPDYRDMPLEQALADLRLRIKNYEQVYEPVSDDEHVSYIKLINLCTKVICCGIHGSLAHLIAAFLMSIHLRPRPIFLVRAGHCQGGDDMSSKRTGTDVPTMIPMTQRDTRNDTIIAPDPATVAATATTLIQSSTLPSPNSKLPHSVACMVDQEAAQDEQNTYPTLPFHIPFTISMAAHLDISGRAFAARLNKFITRRCNDWLQQHHQELEDGHTQPVWNQQVPMTIETSNISSTLTTPPPLLSTPSTSTSATCLPLVIYSSTLPRSIETVGPLVENALMYEQQSSLNMMDTGVCSGKSIQEIMKTMPEELEKWNKQKFIYRFPGGESQQDKAKSLEPLIMEIERQTLPVLCVSHASTLQVLYGYFLGSDYNRDTYYTLSIPQHTVIELRPHQYGWQELRHDLSHDFTDAEYTAMVAPVENAIQGSPSSALRTMDRAIPPTIEGGRRPKPGEIKSKVISHGAQFYKT